jgi:hypothetical protein
MFEVLNTEYLTIEACLGYGVFEFIPPRFSDSFSVTAEIDWLAPRRRNYRLHKRASV